jgi:hypothetical protein
MVAIMPFASLVRAHEILQASLWLIALAGILLVPLSPTLGLAHGGGTDAKGCHVKRATGDYHCHRGGSLTSGMGNVKRTQTTTRRQKSERVYRPVRADFEAVPFRPDVSRSDTICACSRQARCTGPRGGVYCINGSGNKRYF